MPSSIGPHPEEPAPGSDLRPARGQAPRASRRTQARNAAGDPEIAALAAALKRGERRALARAVTLVESTRADHRRRAEALIERILPATGGATRIGISGPPGA